MGIYRDLFSVFSNLGLFARRCFRFIGHCIANLGLASRSFLDVFYSIFISRRLRSQSVSNSDDQHFDPRLQRMFEARFAHMGGSPRVRSAYTGALIDLARSMIREGGITIYADYIDNNEINAFVSKEDENIYLIGITIGVHRRVFELVGQILDKLDVKFLPNARPRAGHKNLRSDLHYTLYFYALVFVLGHECAHIRRGHLDEVLSLKGMAAERGANTSQSEEAEADAVGGLSMAYMKEPFSHLCQMLGPTAATSLMQIPVVAVFMTMRSEPHSAPPDERYPDPVARMMLTGRTILDFFSAFAEMIDPDHKIDRRMCESYLSNILDAVDSNINAMFRDKIFISRMRHSVSTLNPPMKAIVDEWLEDGFELLAFDEIFHPTIKDREN